MEAIDIIIPVQKEKVNSEDRIFRGAWKGEEQIPISAENIKGGILQENREGKAPVHLARHPSFDKLKENAKRPFKPPEPDEKDHERKTACFCVAVRIILLKTGKRIS